MPLYLSADEILSIAPSSLEVERVVTNLFGARNSTAVLSSPRSEYGNKDTARFLAFPSVVPHSESAGIKWLAMPRGGYRGSNGKLSAILLLNDAESGSLLAILDGEWITAARTAMVSLIAARILANPSSRRIAFIGCGNLAELHLDLFRSAFPIDTVVASGRTSDSVNRFIDMAARKGLKALPAKSNRECMLGADIVIATASAPSPEGELCRPEELKPGCFVSHVDLGRSFSWPPDSGSRLVVDDVDQYLDLVRNGNFSLSSGRPAALSDLMTDPATSSARFKSTTFVPTGWGAADIAIARLLFELARAAGKGIPFPD